MMLISLMLFYFCCCSLLLQVTKATVRIGVITNPDTRIGKEQKIAIKVAIESFSTNDSVLILNATDLHGTDAWQSKLIAEELIRWGAQVIITTGTPQQVLVAGTTTSGASTPIISLMPSSFITGPFAFQISYPDASFVKCIADFVKLHNWKKVITIYQDDPLGLASNTNLILEGALREIGSYVEYHAAFSLQESLFNLEKMVELKLHQMKKCESTVYIILRSTENLTLSLFKKAEELNMASPRYIWICGNDNTDLLNTTLLPTFIANNMQGVVGIKSYIHHSTEYQEFFSKFQRKFASDYGNYNENFFNPGVYAVRAYDAMHAVSIASSESKRNNKTLAEALSVVNFEGLSGAIVSKHRTFNNNNEMEVSYFQIFGIIGEMYSNLGFWHENYGFNPGMQNLSWLYGLLRNKESMKPGGLRKLRVGIPARPFWNNFVNVGTSLTKSCSIEIDTNKVTGFCIDVFTEALNILKYNVSYQFIAYTTKNNTSCHVKTYNDFPNLVHSQEVDLVVGDVTILVDRSKNASFTQPFVTSELVMVIPKKSTNIGWFSRDPFSRQLWICIAGILFSYILLVWLLERNDGEADQDFKGPIWRQFAASFWLLCNSIFLKIDEGVGSYHTKIVLLWWFLLVQVLFSSFTASLSSILVNDKLNLIIGNLKVGYNSDSFVYDYLKSNLNYKPENLVKIDTAHEFRVAFENGTITAAYLELPYLRVFLSENNNYMVYGESRTLGGLGFIFPKWSPLRDDFSTAILKLQDNGRIMQLQKQWLNTSLSSSPNSKKENTQSSLGVANFLYLFIFSTCFAILTTMHKFIHMWWTCQTHHVLLNTQGGGLAS